MKQLSIRPKIAPTKRKSHNHHIKRGGKYIVVDLKTGAWKAVYPPHHKETNHDHTTTV